MSVFTGVREKARRRIGHFGPLIYGGVWFSISDRTESSHTNQERGHAAMRGL